MHPNQIQVGKIYQHKVIGVYFIGAAKRKTDQSGHAAYPEQVIGKHLVLLTSNYNQEGLTAISHKKNPDFWKNIVKTDKKIQIIS